MSIMNTEIYSAFKSVADYQTDINEVKADLKLIKWGIGLIIVAEVLPILKNFFT